MYHYNLGHYFSDTVKEKAQNLALSYSENSYSYESLNYYVECLACLLIKKGCKRGDVIAIANNKHHLSYALMLAALRLGVTYVNVDSASPKERNSRILKVCGALFLFCDSIESGASMSAQDLNNECELVFLDQVQLKGASEVELIEQEKLMFRVDGSCIAYIMFTSGSTGIPKGVAVTHQNVLHFISWGQQHFKISEEDNFANLSPMYFDNSVFDFFLSLFSGATLTPILRELLSSPYELVQHVSKNSCSIWFSVPSLLIYLKTMKAMTSQVLPTLRTIVFGGEGYPKVELKKLYDDFSGQTQLVNVYGPTECTCICSSHTIENNDFELLDGLPTLGGLNPNFDYKILDGESNESNVGELCLIGPNVASGYFNDLERTAESFETLTEKNRYMKRMYHTGDLVELINNKFYFKGRLDNQIKHMGYRIELEEIELEVQNLEHVVQVAVVYKRVNAAFGKIYCYVQAGNDFNEKKALSELTTRLPDYMLPQKIEAMDELPKNPNGKVDRRALLKL